MMAPNKFMIIGAGFGQLPAIKAAKELGLEVICIDRNSKAVGMSIADFSYQIDVVDFEGALSIAKKHQINGVMTLQSDLPVPTVGFINDKLGLKGVTLEVANRCSDKVLTRSSLSKYNCAQPIFQVVEDLEEAKSAVKAIGLPCVIKAPDSSGSRGVVKVLDLNQIEDAFKEAYEHSRSKKVLVEEFIDGLEFGAQTFSVNGKCESVLLHNDIMSQPPFMIPIGHSFPFNQLDGKQRVQAEDDIRKAIQALGIFDGPANVDLILEDKTKRVKIIEVGSRIGATCLPELVHHFSGIDWIKESIKLSSGQKVDLKPSRSQPVSARIITSPKDGIFIEYRKPKKTYPELQEFEITVSKGDNVNKLRKGTDRIGKVLMYGESPEQADQFIVNFLSESEVIVE